MCPSKAESPTAQLLQFIHNEDLVGVQNAIENGAVVYKKNFNALEYTLIKYIDKTGGQIVKQNFPSNLKMEEILDFLMDAFPEMFNKKCLKLTLDLNPNMKTLKRKLKSNYPGLIAEVWKQEIT